MDVLAALLHCGAGTTATDGPVTAKGFAEALSSACADLGRQQEAEHGQPGDEPTDWLRLTPLAMLLAASHAPPLIPVDESADGGLPETAGDDLEIAAAPSDLMPEAVVADEDAVAPESVAALPGDADLPAEPAPVRELAGELAQAEELSIEDGTPAEDAAVEAVAVEDAATEGAAVEDAAVEAVPGDGAAADDVPAAPDRSRGTDRSAQSALRSTIPPARAAQAPRITPDAEPTEATTAAPETAQRSAEPTRPIADGASSRGIGTPTPVASVDPSAADSGAVIAEEPAGGVSQEIVERVTELVERMATLGSRRMVVEAGELRLAVALLGSAVSVTVLGGSTDDSSWSPQLAAALASRGLQLAADSGGFGQRREGANRERPDADTRPPLRTAPSTSHRFRQRDGVRL